MARSETGTSGLGVPATDRVTAATFMDRNHQTGGDQERRRRRQYTNPNRASIFDLLFEEVDNTPEIEDRIKRRLKQNVRRSFRQRADTTSAEPYTAGSPPVGSHEPPPSPADDLIKVVIPAARHTDTEHLIQAAAESEEHQPSEDILEARRIASQLRYCLSQHTETAFKVSAYLRALLVLTHGHYKPRLVIEV